MTGKAQLLPAQITPSTAVTIVVHGLNNKPTMMMEIADFLRKSGSDVVLVSLTGHENNEEVLGNISRQVWLNDMYEAYQLAKSTISQLPKPVYFVGFSLGPLINLDLMAQFPETVHYDKMVFLAPANAFRKRVEFLRWISNVFHRKWRIPSMIPKQYRAITFTPVQAYKVLFEIATAVEQAKYKTMDIPVLVIVDPKDEMISLTKLKQTILKYNLHQWRIYELKKINEPRAIYHHLIVDESSIGSQNWAEVQFQISEFLHL